ncbi:MAG: LmbE family protein, partial [Bacteroidia bacterium]
LLGKSYGEIAAESRSMHKSQGFGSAKQRGEYFEYFKPIKGDTAGLKDIFEGIDFSWKRVKDGEKIGGMIEKIVKDYKVGEPEKSFNSLEKVYTTLKHFSFNEHVEYKFSQVENLLNECNGILIEATTPTPLLAVGEKSRMTYSIVSRARPITINSIEPKPGNHVFNLRILVDSNIIINKNQSVKIERGASVTYFNIQPFWLANPINKNLFMPDGNYQLRYYPELPISGISTVNFKYDNIQLCKYVIPQYKWVDPEKGELYRPVVITPPVMINPQSKLVTFTDNKVKELRVSLKAGRDSVNGLIQIALPKGWYVVLKGSKFNNQLKAPTESAFTFSLAKKGDVEDVVLEINPYEGAQDTTINITALVDGQTYTKGIKEIKYDHIPVQTLFPEAEVKLVKLDVVKKSKRVGYIPGAGDEVQACLSQLGYEVTTLTDDKLASENLSVYDAIITGVRAYNTNEKLPSFKQKLMDYVAAGGNLIVQYNTNSWAGPLS